MEIKIFTAPIELKADGDDGEFKATFATLNVVDLDEDVTVDGAFKAQETLVEPWNHGRTLPVGSGKISVEGNQAVVNGKFFLDTVAGLENYKTVKKLSALTEWSYTFRILKAEEGQFEGRRVRFLKELDVVGVSPVSRGAGVDTHTDSIKNSKTGQDDDQDGGKGEVNGQPEEVDSGKPRTLDVEIMIAEAEIIINRMEISNEP